MRVPRRSIKAVVEQAALLTGGAIAIAWALFLAGAISWLSFMPN